MKTSDVFKTTYGITLGFMCAKFTFTCCCSVIEKLCDVGLNKIDKVERNRKVNYKPYYTNEKKETCAFEEELNGGIKVTCSSKKTLYNLLENINDMFNVCGYLSVHNLKDLIGFKTELSDIAIGWMDKDAYHMDWKENALVFQEPLDISDVTCGSSFDLDEEEEKEDEVEASE